MSLESNSLGKVISSGESRRRGSPPLLLCLLCALIFGGAYSAGDPGTDRPFFGQLGDAFEPKPGAEGWHFQMDLRGLNGLWFQALESTFGWSLEAPSELQERFVWQAFGGPDTPPVERRLRPKIGAQFNRDSLFSGSPRARFGWRSEGLDIRGNLYQGPKHAHLLSGRLEVGISMAGFDYAPGGGTLDHLRDLPHDTELLLSVDLGSLRVPNWVAPALFKEWERWEFFPRESFGEALGPAAVYARWRNQDLFLFELKNQRLAEALIQARFPTSVIRTVTRRSFGTLIRGFPGGGPAWYIRKGRLLALPKGGLELAEGVLTELLARDRSFQASSPLMVEVERLRRTHDDWIVCLVERSPQSSLHWAVLLRWSMPRSRRAVGFLVVEVRNPQVRERATSEKNL